MSVETTVEAGMDLREFILDHQRILLIKQSCACFLQPSSTFSQDGCRTRCKNIEVPSRKLPIKDGKDHGIHP